MSTTMRPRPGAIRRRTAYLATAVTVVLTASLATAASNWAVGLAAGSSASAQSAGVSSITIVQVTGTTTANQLYPGGTGDVLIKVSNPNPFPVTITGITTTAAYAVGYTDTTFTTTRTGCDATDSTVTWAGTAGSHTLSTALVIAASGQPNNPLTVTLTGEAAMGLGAPAACESTSFSMPSLTAITATGAAATPTSSPATDTYS